MEDRIQELETERECARNRIVGMDHRIRELLTQLRNFRNDAGTAIQLLIPRLADGLKDDAFSSGFNIMSDDNKDLYLDKNQGILDYSDAEFFTLVLLRLFT